jgi:hypothetical protein
MGSETVLTGRVIDFSQVVASIETKNVCFPIFPTPFFRSDPLDFSRLRSKEDLAVKRRL